METTVIAEEEEAVAEAVLVTTAEDKVT